MLQTFWKTEIGSCSVTPLRARPHLWAAFLQAQSGAGRCEANAWAMDVSTQLVDRATEIEVSRCSKP